MSPAVLYALTAAPLTALAALALRWRDGLVFAAIAAWVACFFARSGTDGVVVAALLHFGPAMLIPGGILMGWLSRMVAGEKVPSYRFREVATVVLLLFSCGLFLRDYGMALADHAARKHWSILSEGLMLAGIHPSAESAYALYRQTPPQKRPDLLRMMLETRRLWWTKPRIGADGTEYYPLDPSVLIRGMLDDEHRNGSLDGIADDPEFAAMAHYLARSTHPDDKKLLWTYLSGGTSFQRKGGTAFARMLLNAGADPEVAVPEARHAATMISALSQAAGKGAAAHVALLLKAGADPKKRDLRGNTALHYAAFTGNAASATLLLKAGAPVNATDESGRTPLMQAMAWRKDKEAIAIVRALLDAGADPRREDRNGESPLTLAVRGAAAGNADSARILALFRQRLARNAQQE